MGDILLKKKVLITDYNYSSNDIERKLINDYGADLVETQARTEDDVIKNAFDADAIITQYAPITEKVIKSLRKCKIIVTYGIGVDKIDVKAASLNKIFVSNVPDYCLNEVAEHTIALLFCLARKIIKMDINIREGLWGYKNLAPIYRIKDRTVGIIGFGNIARILVKKLRAFNFKNILIYDPYVKSEKFEKHNLKFVTLEELIMKSDFISLHAPLNKETFHLIGEKQFKMMKPNSYIINVGRGSLIEEKCLYKSLKERWIGGAAVDVYENEPLTLDNPLLSLDNIILTPHAAWYSEEAIKDLKKKVAEESS